MLAVLFLVVLVDLIGFGIIIPLLPFYGEEYGATPDQVGLLMATFSLTQFLAAPLLGRLSDRYGRRPIIVASLFGSVIAYIWLGLADSLWSLFAARAFGGAMAGNIGAAFAYAADVTRPEERAKGMGLMGAAFGLGFILGPAIGGTLAGPDPLTANYHVPAFVAAAMSATSLLLALIILKESLSPEVRARARTTTRAGLWHGLKQILSTPVLAPLVVMIFTTTLVFAGMESTFALWSERQFGWGPAQNGYVFASVGILSAAIQGGLILRLSRRFGETRLTTAGAGFLALGLGLVPFSDNLITVACALGALGIGFSIINPSLNTLVSRQAKDHEQGQIMGLVRSASILARVVGPTCAGFLFAALGRHWPYISGAVIMLAVMTLAVFYHRTHRDRP